MTANRRQKAPQELIQRLVTGDKRALARLLTIIERDGLDVAEVVKAVHPHAGKGYCLGVTGPPGAGKSTLVDQLIFNLRKQEGSPTVGILAADPTSPFSGGAILADRVRMQRHYRDQGVFIRSMATRGSHGGLPKTTRRAVKCLDAFGADFIIVETVGVGQAELDIMDVADTVVVVLVPEGGDSLQTMKAGLMEIADVFVVNKSDRPGSNDMVKYVSSMLSMGSEGRPWIPLVLDTQANEGIGIEGLADSIEAHRQSSMETGTIQERRRARRRNEFLQTIRDEAEAQVVQQTSADGRLSTLLQEVESDRIDPYTAALQALSGHEIGG